MDYLRKNNMMNYEREKKIREIIKEELNNKCMDCKSDNPEYISLNNGVFICKNCFKMYHIKFPINISRTIRNNLRNLTLKELHYLYFGGNKKMLEFMKYEYPKLIKINSLFVYKTVAMEYYRNWLKYMVDGGVKPIKPDIEVAYNSIDDKIYKNNNNIISNNNNSDVITIDFFNDCYNYNDKFNNSITNFIKKKPESNSNTNINNYKYDNNNINRYRNPNEKPNYQRLIPSNNLKDFLNYYKTLNKNNYDKYIYNNNNSNNSNNFNSINYNNNQYNLNDNFSKTQINFANPRRKKITDYEDNNNNNNYDYESNRSNRMSQDNLIKDIDNNFDVLNNNKSECNFNIILNTNNKILRAFKTNNRIYIKPKHNFIKSFDREPNLEKNQKNEEINDNKNPNSNDNREVLKSIRVKRDTTNMRYNFDDKNKDNKGRNNEKNINSNCSNENMNDNNSLINNQNRIKVCGLRSKYAKKRINNTFSILNKTNDEADKEKIIDKDKEKEKDKEKDKDKEIEKDKEKEKVKDKEVEKDKEKEKDKNDITQDNEDDMTTKSNINDNNISLNNLIFKKKNLRNNFYFNSDKKHNKNTSSLEHSNFDLSKNGIEIKNGVDTTRDDGKSYEESYDDTQNTVQSLPVNRSMRQFHSRYPRKMKRSKTNRKKLNHNKNKEKKEKKYIRLKKEKSEIIQSLKILLRKKEEIKNDEEKYETNFNNIENKKDNRDKNEDLLYNYKCIDNDSRKKIFVNKIRNEELNKIMIDETKKNRKGSIKMNNNNNNINININNNYNSISYINEDDKKNNDDDLSKKIIHVRQSEELLQKGEKISVRNKYKKKYKI